MGIPTNFGFFGFFGFFHKKCGKMYRKGFPATPALLEMVGIGPRNIRKISENSKYA